MVWFLFCWLRLNQPEPYITIGFLPETQMHAYQQSTFLQKVGFNDNMNGTMTETTLCDVTQGTETFAHIYQCSDNIQNQGPVAL